MAFVLSPFLPALSSQNALTPLRRCSNTQSAVTSRRIQRRTMATLSPVVQEKGAGMRIIKAADNETISKLGCHSWAKWGCGPSKFPWSYSDDEVCLVLEGDFTVFPDDGSDSMDIEAGDIAYFPKGMSCTWEVRKTISKHYVFGQKL